MSTSKSSLNTSNSVDGFVTEFRTSPSSIWLLERGRIGKVCRILSFTGQSDGLALSGSRHIESLLDKQLIRLVESPSLAKIYSARNFSPKELDDLQKSAQQVETPKEREQQVTERLKSEQPNAIDLKSDSSPDLLIVKKDTGRLVSICFGLPQISMEIERASTQVSKEIDKVNEDRTQKASVEKQ